MSLFGVRRLRSYGQGTGGDLRDGLEVSLSRDLLGRSIFGVTLTSLLSPLETRKLRGQNLELGLERPWSGLTQGGRRLCGTFPYVSSLL